MKRGVLRLAMLAVLASWFASAFVSAQEPSTTAARTAVDTWLSLIDGQKYAASWDTAAGAFRKAVTQEQWATAVRGARAPLGALKSRALKSATPAASLPGAPDGEYVVFQFDAVFEQKAAAVETVTAMKAPDGSWHVAGYFIK
jgi:hypothetical protein